MPTLKPEDWQEPEGDWTPEQLFWFAVGNVILAAIIAVVWVLESMFAEGRCGQKG